MFNEIEKIISGKKILILGFGKEGKSTFRFLSTIHPISDLAVADRNRNCLQEISSKVRCIGGEHYLDDLNKFDLIIKSPGIPSRDLLPHVDEQKISSQTALFLKQYHKQVIGITGTKGKSTTSSLIYYILKNAGKSALLVGNIGLPPFDIMHQIKSDSKIVFEMSSHQLEWVVSSPHISVLLNLYQEHLDHYPDFNAYQEAKWNITRYQKTTDVIFTLLSDPLIKKKFKENGTAASLNDLSLKVISDQYTWMDKFRLDNRINLPGEHNLINIYFSIAVSKYLSIEDEKIREAIRQFKGLPHRLEFIGDYMGVRFYNDSISTIPESAIAAVKALSKVDTLILGGKDRGVSFKYLIEFLIDTNVRNIIFTGEAGRRIYKGLKAAINDRNLILLDCFADLSKVLRKISKKGDICLLSPAASSYDEFNDYAERGRAYKEIIQEVFR